MTDRPENLGQLALNKKGGMFHSGKCNCPASLQVLRSNNSETNDGNQEIIIIWLLCKQNITGLKKTQLAGGTSRLFIYKRDQGFESG